MTTSEMLQRARRAVPAVAALTAEERTAALCAMADALEAGADRILAANAADCAAAEGKISPVMIDRLMLNEARIAAMAQGIREVAALPDPLGRVISSSVRPNGLCIERVSVPLGVIGIIYESRPNVTSDAAALCFKSGNVCVLKPGKEAAASASAIVGLLKEALLPFGAADAVNIPEDTSRAAAAEMMAAVGLIDVLIPRGGAGLIRACVTGSKVPCIQTGTGICHVYVDAAADQEMALKIIENAKTSRPSVCNAEEVCLVDRSIASEFLPKLKKRLTDCRTAAGKPPVELRLCPESAVIIDGTPASDTDFDTEFLDYILAVKVVGGVKEAVGHISAHSTGHSDAIVTSDPSAAEYFLNTVDSAAVYHNASTRFTDGGEFGLGCEIGISTQKLHARGPMGLCELTSYKYVVRGSGQTRGRPPAAEKNISRPEGKRRDDDMKNKKRFTAGFIGCGNMGGALAAVAAKAAGKDMIAVCDTDASKTAAHAAQYGTAPAGLAELAADSGYVFLGVKPQVMSAVLAELKELLPAEDLPVIVTMAAGIGIASVAKGLGGEGPRIIRIMPNMPCRIGEGMVLYACGEGVTEEEKAGFLRLLDGAGRFAELPERLIDAGCALSGSGPAYAFIFIEALADAGVECGLPRETAQTLAAQTLLGSAASVLEYGNPAAQKDAVCSPGGTTVAGVHALEDRGFRSAVMAAVAAGYRRALELK